MENFEDLLNHVGIGRWNFLIVLFASWRMFLAPGQYMIGSFIHPSLNHSCHAPPTANMNESDQCTYQIYSNNSNQFEDHICQRWDFDNSTWTSTIHSEFNLACDTKYLGATFTGIYMMANGIGGVINGLFCDIYGRKRMFVIGQTLFCMNLFLPWIPGITSLLIGRTIAGFGAGVVGDTLNIMLMESLVARLRPTISVVVWLPWVFGMATLGGLAYLIRDWRTLYMVCTLPYILIIPAMWLLDESPRWLISMGRQDEALKILNKAARWHGTKLPPENEIKKAIGVTNKGTKDEKKMTTVKLLKLAKSLISRFYLLVKTPMMRKLTLVSSYNFTAMGLFYFGLSLSGVHYSDNPFLYMVFSGLVDLPSTIIPAPMALRFGRKRSSIFCFAMAGCLLLPLPFVSKDMMWLTMTFALSAKAFGGVAWACFHLLVTELFPTDMRVLGLACVGVFVSFASTMAAYIHELLSPLAEWAPSILFSMCSLLASAMVLFLPDTSDKAMPNTIIELEEMHKKSRSKNKYENESNDDDKKKDLLNGKA